MTTRSSQQHSLCHHHYPTQLSASRPETKHTPGKKKLTHLNAPAADTVQIIISHRGSRAFLFWYFCLDPLRIHNVWHQWTAAGTFLCTLVMRVQLKYVYIINGALPYLFYDTDRADFTPKYVNQMWKHASECVGLRASESVCAVCVLCASERAREYLFCAYALHLAATALRRRRERGAVCLMRIKYVLIH